MGRDELLRLLREDPEVQGAVLALLVGAIAPPPPPVPQERRKPDWVLRQLAESDRAHAGVGADGTP